MGGEKLKLERDCFCFPPFPFFFLTGLSAHSVVEDDSWGVAAAGYLIAGGFEFKANGWKSKTNCSASANCGGASK